MKLESFPVRQVEHRGGFVSEHELFDRRRLLVAGGALVSGAALRPLRALAQTTAGKLRIGVNTMSYTIFAREANRQGPLLAVPIAGDDPAAVQIAAGLVRDAGFEPVIVGTLADARRFQRGGPGYGQSVSAAELRQTLSLPR
jgi:hypothetical protein